VEWRKTVVLRYLQLRSLAAVCAVLLFGGLFLAFPAASRAPQIDLAEDLAGKATDPFKLSHGRVLVFLFVRTDCPISNRYAPAIHQLAEKFHGQADFWLVYPDAGESASRIRAHLTEFHYSIPALRDLHHSLVKRAQATITPESAVFDSAGKLVYHGRIDNWYEDFGRSRPAATTHELEGAIRSALEGRAISPDQASAVGCYIADLK
jgi:thiol-disulfide isomerase/thioredoxin